MYVFYSIFFTQSLYFLYHSLTLFERVYFTLITIYSLVFPYYTYLDKNVEMIIRLNKSMAYLPVLVLLPYKNIQLCNYIFYNVLILVRLYYLKCPLRILTNTDPLKGSLSFNTKNKIIMGIMFSSLVHYSLLCNPYYNV